MMPALGRRLRLAHRTNFRISKRHMPDLSGVPWGRWLAEDLVGHHAPLRDSYVCEGALACNISDRVYPGDDGVRVINDFEEVIGRKGPMSLGINAENLGGD